MENNFLNTSSAGSPPINPARYSPPPAPVPQTGPAPQEAPPSPLDQHAVDILLQSQQSPLRELSLYRAPAPPAPEFTQTPQTAQPTARAPEAGSVPRNTPIGPQEKLEQWWRKAQYQSDVSSQIQLGLLEYVERSQNTAALDWLFRNARLPQGYQFHVRMSPVLSEKLMAAITKLSHERAVHYAKLLLGTLGLISSRFQGGAETDDDAAKRVDEAQGIFTYFVQYAAKIHDSKLHDDFLQLATDAQEVFASLLVNEKYLNEESDIDRNHKGGDATPRPSSPQGGEPMEEWVIDFSQLTVDAQTKFATLVVNNEYRIEEVDSDREGGDATPRPGSPQGGKPTEEWVILDDGKSTLDIPSDRLFDDPQQWAHDALILYNRSKPVAVPEENLALAHTMAELKEEPFYKMIKNLHREYAEKLAQSKGRVFNEEHHRTNWLAIDYLIAVRQGSPSAGTRAKTLMNCIRKQRYVTATLLDQLTGDTFVPTQEPQRSEYLVNLFELLSTGQLQFPEMFSPLDQLTGAFRDVYFTCASRGLFEPFLASS